MIDFLLRSNYQDTREKVLREGCYSPEENLRIYEKWFKNAPRYLFRAVDAKYHISSKRLCDVGCEFGMNLLHCTKDSYGIEIIPQSIAFARALGITVVDRDAIEKDLSDLPKVEAIWFSAMLEHVEAPHTILRKLHGLLSPGGLLCVYVPTIPPFPFLRRLPKIGKFFDGYLHGDHINAFTPATLRFACERAGFETVEVSPFYPSFLKLFHFFPLADGVVYIGRKKEGWEYPYNSTRKVVEGGKGFGYKTAR